MRVLQAPVPAARVGKESSESLANTLSYFAIMATAMAPLVDDGAGSNLFRGKVTGSPPCVSKITGEISLLLIAKDLDTIQRGLNAYSKDVWISSDEGGLGMVIVSYDRGKQSRVKGFVQWGLNSAKQHFLHSSFKMAGWLLKHGMKFEHRSAGYKALGALFHRLGIDHRFTFEDFCNAVGQDARIISAATMVLICRVADLSPGLEVPGGTVIRYIDQSIKLSSLGDIAARAKNVRAPAVGQIGF